VKAPEIYSDWRIAIGFALILLGVGNWYVGLRRAQQAGHIIEQSSIATTSDYRSFDELEAGAGGAVLRPFSDEAQRVSYATARMDFYHAAFLSGQAMLLVGLGFIIVGFIGLIQRDMRRAVRSVTDSRGGTGSLPV